MKYQEEAKKIISLVGGEAKHPEPRPLCHPAAV